MHHINKIKINEKYGKLTVVSPEYRSPISYVNKLRPNAINYNWVVDCQCDCGNTYTCCTKDIGKKIKSCGCSQTKPSQVILHIGDRFNNLTVISDIYIYKDNKNRNKKVVLVKCDCGQISERGIHSLGLSRFCKHCFRGKSHLIHGLSHTRLWRIWNGIKSRCNKPSVYTYRWYGARGIRMSDEWNDFMIFYQWSKSHGYNDNLTIERINKDGNYEPSNCEWITRSENSKRRNAYYTNKIKELELRIEELQNNMI